MYRSQQFEINCFGGCPGGGVGGGRLAAANCTIKSATTGGCVQVGSSHWTAGTIGDSIFTTTCEAIDSQRFNFATLPSAPPGFGAGESGFQTLSASGSLSDVPSVDNDGKLGVLIRNSYIVMGLVGIGLLLLLLLVVFAISMGMPMAKSKYKRVSKYSY